MMAFLYWLLLASGAPGACVGLGVEVDGATVEPAALELHAANQQIPVEECPGGFLVPDVNEAWVDVVVATPGRRFKFDHVSARKLQNMSEWRVVVETPPFVPSMWSLDVPWDVIEVMTIGFSPLRGDGTSIAVYEHRENADVWAPASWREVLARADLLDDGAWICPSSDTEWSLDGPLKVVTTVGLSEEAACGTAGKGLRGESVRELVTDAMEDCASAATADLFEVLLRAPAE
jgi:hypothetical protein